MSESGTLAQAAITIGVTQPSATKMLADIELAFQFPLFKRHPHGMRPTSPGHEVVAYARQSQAGLSRFLEGLEVKRRGGHGQLVISAIMGAAPDLLARAVAAIKRERPSIFATLQLLQTSDAIGALPESVVRDHVKARLLRTLPVMIGKDLKGFGILTRMGEPLSDTASAFVTQLRHFARDENARQPART